MSKPVDIEVLRGPPAVIIAAISFSVAIVADVYLLPDKGKIVGFSTFASLLALYSARPMLRYWGAKAFIIGYICLHIGLVFLPLTDSSVPGLVLVPFVMADYVAMAFGVRAFTVRTIG